MDKSTAPFEGIAIPGRRKRTQRSSRPKPESQPVLEGRGQSSMFSENLSDTTSKLSSYENAGSSKGKVFNLNQCASRGSSGTKGGSEHAHKESKKDEGLSTLYGNGSVKVENEHGGLNEKLHKGGVDHPSRQQGLVGDGVATKCMFKKVKVKFGGARTIETKPPSHATIRSGSSTKSAQISYAPGPRPKLILQDDSDEDTSPPMSDEDGKKAKSDRVREDTDYEQEEELISEGKNKKLGKDITDSPAESKKEMVLTTRQRALLSGKDSTSVAGANEIEFPKGLPPPPPQRQKEKLTDIEQQLKKAEAGERRRLQKEKAAQESEAEAIRKILGQDSSRKKREDKIKKRQEELAQERAVNARTLPPNTIRWVMSPTGTTVTFSDDVGLPHIFDPKPCSYPPPREKCAGPSCSNPYKYRDSKTKVPLCSLQCYKAIHEKMQGGDTSC